MGVRAKIAALCAAGAMCVCAVGVSAYVISEDAISAQFYSRLSADGVLDAQDMLSVSLIAPSGNINGISPLKVNCLIDIDKVAASGAANADGDVCLKVSIRYAFGTVMRDEVVAREVLSEGSAQVASAYVADEDGGKDVAFTCSSEVSGEDVSELAFTSRIVLSGVASVGGECFVSFDFSPGGGGQERIEFFKANPSALFEVSTAIAECE